MNPREILNKYKWHQDFSFSNLEIFYIHRGAPEDTKIIYGKDIEKIGRSFIHTRKKMIPFHRVFKIKYNKKTIFLR